MSANLDPEGRSKEAMMRVLDVHPLKYGANPAVDAMAHGLVHRLEVAGIETRIVIADFLQSDWLEVTERAVERALGAGYAGLVLYVLDAVPLEKSAELARTAGVPVFTFARAPFEVEASLVYPNFNHGLYMVEHLASMLAPGAGIGIIGGPKVSDDQEEVAGIVYGARLTGLELLNDPEEERYRNKTDAIAGGREAALRLVGDVPHLDGLVPYNDETMLGAVQALDEVGRAGEAKIVSRNGSPKAVQAVKEGRTDGTWDIECPQMGAALAELIIRRLVEGEELNGELGMAPVGRMITRDNADQWRPWSERIPMRELKFGFDS